MRSLTAIAAPLVAVAIAGQAAQADQPPSPPPAASAQAPSEISRPIWVRTPSGDDYADDYPELPWAACPWPERGRRCAP